MTAIISDDSMSKIFEYGEKITEKFIHLGETYGPNVVDLGLNVYRIQAAQSLLIGFLCLMVIVGTLTYTYFILPKVVKWNYGGEETLPFFLFGVFSLMISYVTSFFCLFGLYKIFSIWNWIGLWYPEVLIAKQILNL